MNIQDKIQRKIDAVKLNMDMSLPCKTQSGTFMGKLGFDYEFNPVLNVLEKRLCIKIGNWKKKQISYDYAFDVMTNKREYILMGA